MKPKLSVVAVVRNDNYGDYFEDRLTGFFRSLSLCPYKLDLILVEWNPPKNKPSFYKQFRHILPSNHDIRIITVPEDVHSTIPNPGNFPVLEYVGKNVGIRRAMCKNTLCTNPDNIYLPETWHEIKQHAARDVFLRIHRYSLGHTKLDFSALSIPKIVSKLPKLYIRKWNQSLTTSQISRGAFDGLSRAFVRASGDFICADTAKCVELGGYDERQTYSRMDSIMLRKLMSGGIRQKVLKGFIYHIEHSRPHMRKAKKLGMITVASNKYVQPDDWGLAGTSLPVLTIKSR